MAGICIKDHWSKSTFIFILYLYYNKIKIPSKKSYWKISNTIYMYETIFGTFIFFFYTKSGHWSATGDNFRNRAHSVTSNTSWIGGPFATRISLGICDLNFFQESGTLCHLGWAEEGNHENGTRSGSLTKTHKSSFADLCTDELYAYFFYYRFIEF